MDDFENLIVKATATCFVVLVSSIASCSSYSTYRQTNLLEGAADPIAMRCAYSGNAQDGICAQIAAKWQPQKP